METKVVCLLARCCWETGTCAACIPTCYKHPSESAHRTDTSERNVLLM